MPTYEYRCKECGEHLEVVQSFADDPLTECPACEGLLKKVFNSVGISFKGSGFYKTDSRIGSSSTSSSSSGSSSGDGGSAVLVRRATSSDRRPAASSSSDTQLDGELDARLVVTDSPRRRAAPADVGVYGGSGLYSLLDDVEEVVVDTPFGPPAAPVTIGEVAGRRVAFLPRHGRDHTLPPHRVPYRANAWALRELGVRAIFGPCASGSLQADIHPGEFVVLDQIVDRTAGRAVVVPRRARAAPTGIAPVDHVTFADPYDDRLRTVAVAACRAEGVTVHEGGTVVVIEGPRFSTRAESRWYAAQGWQVINMTQMPEAALAAEMGIPYAAIALITDYDAGLEGQPGIEPVTMDEVVRHARAQRRAGAQGAVPGDRRPARRAVRRLTLTPAVRGRVGRPAC